MSGKFFIKRADIQDMARVSRLYVDSWKLTYPGLVPDWYLDGMNYADFEQFWRQYINEPGRFILTAASENDCLAGMAAAQTDWETPGTGYIAALHVDRQFRGLGLSRKLIKAVSDTLALKDITRLALSVIEGNDNAMGVYLHLGAEKIDYRICKDGFAALEYVLLWPDTRLLRG
ncbi:MAG: GNAT family N-acetyltransferase [Desulfovibrionaceae bacterium]|nr:GNAT family N-acetyltransferase [Desulfovibrionaceae bacterium]